jgi:type I restriction enzyme S subunit
MENNRRRIIILESAARLLYREWFANLRFPGHEQTKIIDGFLEGWKKKSAFELLDILSGGTPKTDIGDYWDGEIPFYTPKDANSSVVVYKTEKHVTERGLKACNSALYPRGTLFITARGTVGKLNLAGRAMAMNQSCYALVAHPPITQEFLYFAISAGVEELRSRAGGAVFDAIIRDTFKHISLVIPTSALIAEFTQYVKPLLAFVENLQAQNRGLVKARAILLPKLISGEVEV